MAAKTHFVSLGDPSGCADQPTPCVGFFSPAALSISVGDTVRWTNDGNIAHTVTSGTGGSFPGDPDGLWDSGFLDLGQSYSRTFDTPGTFTVFCTLHPVLMGTATITVEG